MHKLIAPLALGAAAGILVAGCTHNTSSTSGTGGSVGRAVHASSKAMGSGTETISGTEKLTPAQAASSSYVPVIQVKATGVFADSGSITLTPGSGANGDGPGNGTVKLMKGNLDIHHGATNPNQQPMQENSGICVFSETQKVAYTVAGGTGAYKGASGSGIVTVTFSFTLPVMSTGHVRQAGAAPVCNMANSAEPTAGNVVFSGTGHVSIP